MVSLRRAADDDMSFIMAAERLPGYDLLVGRPSRNVNCITSRSVAARYNSAVDPNGSTGQRRTHSRFSTMDAANCRLSLVVSNDNKKPPDRRTSYLAHAYACHDTALRADEPSDRDILHGMTNVWLMLAQRT